MRYLAVLVATTTFARTLPAQMPQGYLDEFPSAARVLADYASEDTLDGAARQSSALMVLRDLVLRLGRERATVLAMPELHSLDQQYRAAQAAPFGLLMARRDAYRTTAFWPRNAAFREEVLARYFSAPWLAAYRRRLADLGVNEDVAETGWEINPNPRREYSGSGVATEYLAEFPTVEQVFADNQGSDSIDTHARAHVVIQELSNVLVILAGGRQGTNYMSVDEGRIYSAYFGARGLLELSNSPNEEARRYRTLRAQYYGELKDPTDPSPLASRSVVRYFSPSFQAQFAQALAGVQADGRARAERDRRRSESSGSRSTPGLLAEPQAGTTRAQIMSLLSGVANWPAVIGILTGLGVLMLIWTSFLIRRDGGSIQFGNDHNEAIPLTPELRTVRTKNLAYQVFWETGLLYDKEVWTETHVSTTTSGGGTYSSAGHAHTVPVTTSTNVSSTVYHRFWIRTHDGREQWYRFADDEFQATRGQMLSRIVGPTGSILFYNHSTGQLLANPSWTNKLHRPGGGGGVLVVHLLAWLAASTVLLGLSGLVVSSTDLAVYIGFGSFAVLLIAGVRIKSEKGRVVARRNREVANLLPAFRTFLKGAEAQVKPLLEAQAR